MLSIARRAKEIFDSSEPFEKRALLNYLLQNPTVNGKNLEYTMRSPFNLALELAGSPNWLRGLESMRTALIEERLEEIRNAELTKKKILNLE